MGERILWIDVAKVLTMILVVLGHSTYYKIVTDYGGIDFSNAPTLESTTYRILSTLTGFIYTFHVPFFMALSGMTFAMTYKNRSISSIVRKKFQRLLIPFFFVTLFISVPLKIGGGYYDHSEHTLWDIIFGQFFLFGNSHLWFVVSLFIITIVFVFFESARKSKGGCSIAFWFISLIVAYLGLFCERFGGFFGVPGAMRNFIFFALGFALFSRNKSDILKNNIIVISLSWVIMFLVFLITTQINHLLKGFSFITYIPMALWGCFNMASTCKYISYHVKFKSPLFTSLNNESYNIYLFSDPFNYIFIPVAALIMGSEIVDKESTSLLIYILRVLTSIIFAYLIIWIFKLIRQSSAFFIRKIKDLNI